MTKSRRTRYARASIIAIGTTAIIALALLTYADARRVMAERATAKATTPQTERTSAVHGLTEAQAARLARALRSTRIDGATIIYVDDDANTNGDGTSWPTAYNDLQDGLDAAAALGGAPAEIWVAAGTYKPDRGTGNREMSFELVNSTGLYGGFAGDETDFDDRDFRTNETILSGDLLGNDVGTNGRSENSMRIVHAEFVEGAVVDGVTISSSEQEPAVYDYFSSVLYASCTLQANHSLYSGGGMALYYHSSSIVLNCVFSNNQTEDSGGGAASIGAHSLFVNSVFDGNIALYSGGAVETDGLALGRAGVPGHATLINCTVSRNTALEIAGGVHSGSSYGIISLANSILWGNVDGYGTGESAQLTSTSGSTAVDYCCVQGWTGALGGFGNTGADPYFLDAMAGDYRLHAPSSAIDAGSNGIVPADVLTDIAGQPRFVDHPLVPDTGVSTNGLPVVDMGAFEWFDTDCNDNGVLDLDDIAAGTSADINTNGTPDECEPDCNSNGWPDDYDIAENVDLDCNLNRVPDKCDIESGASKDCNGNEAPDECDGDCNDNAFFDGCDLAGGTSHDCNVNAIPDECDIAAGTSTDCDGSGTPDTCDIAAGSASDCNTDGTPDSCLGPHVIFSDSFRTTTINAELWPTMAGATIDGVALGEASEPYALRLNGDPGGGDSVTSAAINLDNATNATLSYWWERRGGGESPDPGEDLIVEFQANEGAWQALASHPGDGPDMTAFELEVIALPVEVAHGGFRVRFRNIATAGLYDDWFVDDVQVTYVPQVDCNGNSVPDDCDLAGGTSTDLNTNGTPDDCEPDCNSNAVPDDYDLVVGTSSDCNTNAVPDECDVNAGTSFDCNSNVIPDACEADCNTNGSPDDCDVTAGSAPDCNGNIVPDECDLTAGISRDCNSNGIPDTCDIAGGTSQDCNANAVPDVCDITAGTSTDCNENGAPDACDIIAGTSDDCNANNVPDSCDIDVFPPLDCNENGIIDLCDINAGTSTDVNANGTADECEEDCNSNGLPDSHELGQGIATDCDSNGLLDDCDLAADPSADCNSNSVLDQCDLKYGWSQDCNSDLTPDECELSDETATDCNENGILDTCDVTAGLEADCNDNRLPDACEIAAGTSYDCNANDVPDLCEIWTGIVSPAYPAPLNATAPTDYREDKDVAVATDGEGTWIAVWSSNNLLSGASPSSYGILFARSLDAGATWSYPAPLIPNAYEYLGNNHSPRIASDGQGKWLAVWSSTGDVGGSLGSDTDMVFARSTDDGGTWTDAELLNANAATDSGWDYYAHMATDGSGTWVVAWVTPDDFGATIGTDYDILFVRSSDHGATWTYPAPLNLSAYADSGNDDWVQLATDRAGNWIAVWRTQANIGGSGGDSEIVLARSADNGATWTYPVAIREDAATDWASDEDPAIATDGQGTWVVTWECYDDFDWTIGSDADIVFARSVDNGATWTFPAPLNANAYTDSHRDYDPQIATDGLGNWIAVWQSFNDLDGTIGTDDDILFARSSDGPASWTFPSPMNVDAYEEWRRDSIPALTTDGMGNWVSIWESYGGAGGILGTDPEVMYTRFRLGTEPDCNSNGLPDECEADCDGNGTPDQCELLWDMNHDEFVDGDDLDAYLACLTGPCVDGRCLPTLYLDECCAAADGDFDGDVDLLDFWRLQQVFDRVCHVVGDCDDGLFCTGVETCVGGLCEAGSYPCTDPVYSVCDEDTDTCTYPPLGGMADDFESYACGDEADFWFDTGADGSLVQNDALFDVVCLGDTQAFHTASTATNIHSHYTELGSADWAAITYTGRMMITDADGGIGVTFMSQYPDAALYYRLRRHQWGQAFHISPSAGVALPQGTVNTNVVPIPNVWYRFKIEAVDTGVRTEIRAKVWRDGFPEPAEWLADCYDDTPARLTRGTVGVWSMGPGESYWDDLSVEVMAP